MSGDRRQQFGAYLTRLRRATGRSQRQLADRLCALSGLQSVTRNEVSRWERGGRVPDAWLTFLAQALDTSPSELARAAAYARGETDTAPPGPDTTLAALLPQGDPLAPLTARTGQRLGHEAVAQLADRVHALRLADDVLAGGDLIAPAFRRLGAAVRLYRESTYAEGVGRALLAQIGELAQITGWIASDAGRHEQAERAYRIGIAAARQAGDRPLTGHLTGSLAYQFSNTGRLREGVELARAALADAGPEAPGKARALFLDRIAWAHTRAGDAQSAMRALDEAHEALSEDQEPAPLWAYWVSRAELRVMDARVYTELRRPLRAVPLLEDVLTQYDATHTREIALYRSWLAIALADANEPEQAAAEAQRVISLSGDVSSERAAERCRVVLRRLSTFRDVPEVRGLLDEHGHLLSV
ncbi:helix-turn-helix domain-containing protein [Streptomyces sp. LX-29]|uniref:helix-turn-helix domain-containing protein n=1 Tax=Streptomyces sp. LX-29 TaxID=2900152 RepID=UPI00240E49B5|nr:helix-turn-helix transcriptional regulator [Streptomyces sp. LX-29]WFB07750.1 helix-turn-helix domain-containing protein [Streptomyces sp. LX-29]